MAKHSSSAQPRAEQPRPIERRAEIANLLDKMIFCLDELDRLELTYAANYLSHSIALVEKDT